MRKSIDDVHLILKYDKDRKEVLVRDNKSDDGTYFADRGEALNNKTFYKFSLESTPSIKLKAGDVELEIKDVAKHFYPSKISNGIPKMRSIERKPQEQEVCQP